MSRRPYSRPLLDPALATYRRAEANEWQDDVPPEDTAPQEGPPALDPATWGRTVDEARDMLRDRRCPVCGEGPWRSPLTHAAKKHGIDRRAMRDACGLTLGEPVCAPEMSAQRAELSSRIDMSTVNHAGKPRRQQQWTQAGRQRNAATLAEWEATHPDEAKVARQRAGKAGAAARWGA